MNYAIIFYTLGVVIDFSAAFMLPPFIVALLYRETDAKPPRKCDVYGFSGSDVKSEPCL